MSVLILVSYQRWWLSGTLLPKNGEKTYELDKLYRGSVLERRIYDYATGDLLHKTSSPKEIARNLITVTPDGSPSSEVGGSYDLRAEWIIRPDLDVVQHERTITSMVGPRCGISFLNWQFELTVRGVRSSWHGLGAVQRGNVTMCRSY